ncbi:hypothetical protein [Synechococcus elongatus]|uniref:hypothetical protein n=1 Tax=Synechococcus elongatus TaxID=32046 RepID=UPI001EDDAC79|nr:hypothetical protein [Synechococcus elongatus]
MAWPWKPSSWDPEDAAIAAKAAAALDQAEMLTDDTLQVVAQHWQLAATALTVSDRPDMDWLVQAEWLRAAWFPLCNCFPSLPAGAPPFWKTLWRLWLPLAQYLAQQIQQQTSPFILGILGGQGCGKTTLGQVLALLLQQQGYRVCSLSLDDGYLSFRDRCQLQTQDPRLIWRGPPGTHDLPVLQQTLTDLRAGQPTLLPRFDKSLQAGAGDRIAPVPMGRVDLVIFEGWFVGCQRVRHWPPSAWPWPIETTADQGFATDCNRRLVDYEPLWAFIDQLLILRPQDFRWSYDWRLQAEQELQRQRGQAMSPEAIADFVQYFWKALHPQLFIEPISQPTAGSKNWVAAIGADHAVTQVLT